MCISQSHSNITLNGEGMNAGFKILLERYTKWEAMKAYLKILFQYYTKCKGMNVN